MEKSEIEKAKALVEQEKTDRSKRCGDRIQQILKEENCDTNIVVYIGKSEVPVNMVLAGKVSIVIIPK